MPSWFQLKFPNYENPLQLPCICGYSPYPCLLYFTLTSESTSLWRNTTKPAKLVTISYETQNLSSAKTHSCVRQCSALTESGPRRLACLTPQYSVSVTVQERLSDVSLSKETWLCWRECVTRVEFWDFKSPCQVQCLSASWLVPQHVSAQLLVQHHACHLPTMMAMKSSLKEQVSSKMLFFIRLDLAIVSLHSTRTATKTDINRLLSFAHVQRHFVKSFRESFAMLTYLMK